MSQASLCLLFVALTCSLAIGCDSRGRQSTDAGSELDSGGLDLGREIDAAFDAGVDARVDTAADATPADAHIDATPFDMTMPDMLPRPDARVVRDFIEAELCTPLIETVCDAFEACRCERSDLPTREECVAIGMRGCIDRIRAGVIASGFFYDEDRVREMVEDARFLAASCRSVNGYLRVNLGQLFYAPIAIGDACPFENAYDRCGEGRGRCLTGMCTAVGAEGDDCSDGFCAAGLICDSRWTCSTPAGIGDDCLADDDCEASAVCEAGRCAPFVAASERCTEESVCARGTRCVDGVCRSSTIECSDDSVCGHGEGCIGDPIYECVERGGLGDSCVSLDDCGGDLVCTYDTLADSATCTPGPIGGESCAATSFCASGYVCDYSSLNCVVMPGIGEPCLWGGVRTDSTYPYTGCSEGLGCLSGTCAPLPSAGERCDDSGRCRAGLTCFPGGGCAIPLDGGEPCGLSDICAEGFYCDLSMPEPVCSPSRGVGEDCSRADCERGLFCDWDPSDSSAVCVRIPTFGESCDELTFCAEPYVCRYDRPTARCQPIMCGSAGVGIDPPPT